MGVLNLGLQRMTLSRSRMPQEEKLKGAYGMSGIRTALEKLPELQKQWLEAMEQPINIITQRFGRLT
jgi:hypothetical protein